MASLDKRCHEKEDEITKLEKAIEERLLLEE